MNYCNCGAKHTSFPNNHYDWCDQVKHEKTLPILEHRGMKCYWSVIYPTISYDYRQDRCFINKKWFDTLSEQEKYATLEHEAIHRDRWNQGTFKIVYTGSGWPTP